MNVLIILAVLFSALGSIGGRDMPPRVASPAPSMDNVIILDDDLLVSVSLPPYGTLCEDTPVRGGPDAVIYEPLYILLAGEVVQLREQPRIASRDWIMIARARWIPLSALCEAE